VILYIGMGVIALAIALAVYSFAAVPAEEPPQLGLRGYKRQRALAAGSMFALFEPVIRKVGGAIAHLPLRGPRRRAAQLLTASGDYLGLTANEYIALIVLGAVGGFLVGLISVIGLGITPIFALLLAGLGAWMPYSVVVGEGNRRRGSIDRELPGTIELLALCMSAGLDFPGAIKQVTSDNGLEETPLREELRRILRELELGHSRRRALEAFSLRVPSEAVRDFVAAVIQSEERGNPLRDVLRVQATVLRTRRTILAEESAARASVLMIGPLVMLLSATLLLIAGPLFIKTVMSSGGGL
jgi:tight adherence protein C